MKSYVPIRLTAEQQEEYTMNAIMESYVLMDDDDWANWSVETAGLLAQDFARYDRQIGLAPIDYDANDIYDTMLAIRYTADREYA